MRHAFGDRLVREFALELGLPTDLRVLSRPETVVFLRERVFELGGLDEGAAWWTVEAVRHLLARPGDAALAAPEPERAGRLVRAWFADDDLGRWLGVNRHDGIAYVNRESFERALRWIVVVAAIEGGLDAETSGAAATQVLAADELAALLAREAAAVGYQVGRLVEHVTR